MDEQQNQSQPTPTQPEQPAPVAPQTPSAPAESPTPPPQSSVIPTTPEKPHGSSNKVLVISAVVVVLLLAGVALIFMMKKPATNTTLAPQPTEKAMIQGKPSPSAAMVDDDKLSSGQDDQSLASDLNKLEGNEANLASDQKDAEEDLTSSDNPENL